MKKIFDKEKLKSHNGIIFVCVVALVCCIGVVNGKLSEKELWAYPRDMRIMRTKRWPLTAETFWWTVSISAQPREVLPMPLRTGIKPAVTARLTKMLPGGVR